MRVIAVGGVIKAMVGIITLFTIIVSSFLLVLVLFVLNPLEPRGVIDFGPPSITNFTGTTTAREVYGYVCEYSHISNGVIQGDCYQAYFGLLQIPSVPIIFPIWIASFAAALILFLFFLFVRYRSRKTPKSKIL